MRAVINADKALADGDADLIADALLDPEGDRLARLALRLPGRSEVLILALIVVGELAQWGQIS